MHVFSFSFRFGENRHFYFRHDPAFDRERARIIIKFGHRSAKEGSLMKSL